MKYLFAILFMLPACVTTREQVEADVYLVKKIPADQCPKGQNHGFYRKIICEKVTQHKLCAEGQPYYIERISFCSDRAETFNAMDQKDVNKWLEKLTRPRSN